MICAGSVIRFVNSHEDLSIPFSLKICVLALRFDLRLAYHCHPGPQAAVLSHCVDDYAYIRVPTLLEEKIPGVFQSNFRIFQVLSVIVRNRISNTFGPQ